MSAPQSTDDLLDSVLADYFQRLDHGEAVSPASLLASHPELEVELREFFDAASFVENLAGPTQSEQTQMLSVHDTARNSLVGETIVSHSSPHAPREGHISRSEMATHFGRYEIQRLLGQGAMGSVYLAYDPSLQRQIALKIPKFSDEANPDMRDRFLREARSAATLRHANICPVYDVGRVDGVHYITMAYIEGRTLAEELRAGRTFEPREIATIVRKLALALGKAHSAGVIHRDLKPGNIMLDAEGEPVLMDFGLAYREETDELRLTKSGMIVGSPAYMSPEQIEGDPAKIGSGSDIYSLGVVLYEMITGKLPFQGTMMSVIGQIATKEPTPIGQYRPELANSPLERLCRKMLAKQVGDRPQTMQEVARALDYILSGLPDGAVGNALRGAVADSETARQREGEKDIVAAVSPSPPLSVSPSLRLAPASVAQVVKFPEAVLAQERRERAKMFLATTLILVTLLGLFGAAAGIVYVATDQGTLEITSHVDNVKIEVIGDNGTVRVIDLANGTTVERLKSGNYTVVVQGNDSRVAIDKGKFQITRGSKVAVTAHLMTNLPRPAQVVEAERKLPTDSPSTRPGTQAASLGAEFPGPQPLARLSDHKHEVRAVAFAPGDQQFVTVGWEREIRLWSTTDHKLIRSWEGHPNGTYRARFLPDGRLLTSGYDATIRLWDVSKGEELKRLDGHRTPVCALAVTPDGKRALSSSFDGTLHLWDLEKLESIRSFQKADGIVWDAALTPDGKTAVTADFGGAVRLWDVEKGESTAVLGHHPDSALAVAFLDDGRKLVSGGRDGVVRLWDVATKAQLHHNNTHRAVWIESLAVSPNGKRVVVGLANPDKQAERHPLAGMCAVMDAESLQMIVYLPSETPHAYATGWSHDGSLVLTGGGIQGQSGSALLWRHHGATGAALKSPSSVAPKRPLAITELARFRGHEEYVLSVAFTKDDKLLASTGADHKIIFWDPATGQSEPTKKLHTDDVRAIAFTPDDSRFVTASNDKTLRVWNAENREVQATLSGHKSSATSVVILPGGQRAISASDDQALILWDLAQANPIFLAGFHKAAVSCLALSPDGKLIASAGKDNLVILSEVQADKLVLKHKMSGHTGEIRGLAFSPDGRYVISGARDGAVRFWTVATGQQYKTLAPGIGIVYSVAVSPDGQYLAVGGGDWTKGSIKIYAFPSGRQLAEVRDFLGFVHALAFTKDSATLAAGSADKHVRLFRLGATSLSSERDASITEVLQIPGHAEHVTSLAVTGDGKTIVSGSADGTVLARDIEPRLTRRAMSGHRRDRQVAVDVSRDGRLIVSGDWDGKLRLNDGSKGVNEIAAANTGGVMSVKLSPDQTKLLTTGGDQTAKVWDAATGELLQTFQDAGWLSDGEFSPSGELAVTSGFDGQLKIRQIADGLVVKDLPTSGAMVSCVSWAPKGDRIAAGLRDGTVRVFSAETGLETVRMVGHADRVRDVVFTTDGSHLLSGSYDRTMRMWNVETGAEIAKVQHEKHIFNALAIAPDGQHVFSAGGIWKPDEEKNEWTPENDYAIRMWRLPQSAGPQAQIPEIKTAERLFTGPRGHGFSVAVSADGTQALVGHYVVSLWDIASGKQIREYSGAEKAIHTVLFWPDGKHVAACSEDGAIRVWNRETADEVRQFKGHTGRVDSVTLSRDGSLLLSAAADYGQKRDSSVRLWNAATGEELRRLGEVVSYTGDLAFSRDASRAYGASSELTAVIEWDVATGAPVHRFRDCPTEPISLDVSPSGRLLATGHAVRQLQDNQWNDPANAVVRLWDLETRSIVRELHGHAGPVGVVAFTPDGKWLLSAATCEHSADNRFVESSDQTVRVWDVANGNEVARYHVQERVNQLAVLPDGTSFITVGESLRLWRLPETVAPPAVPPPLGVVTEIKHAARLDGHNGPIFDLALAAEGLTALSTSDDYFTRVWDLSTRKQVREFKSDGAMRCVAVTADGSLAAWSGGQKTIVVWDLKQNKELKSLTGHTSWVYSLKFTKDNKRLLSASRDKTIRLWDLDKGDAMLTLETINRQDVVARLSPDETKIVANSDNDYTLTLWNIADGQPLAKLHGHGVEGVFAAAFSPDGSQIATADGKGAIFLRDATTGEPRVTWLGHKGRVTGLAFTPDGRWLVSGGFDKVLNAWDARSGQLVARAVADKPVTNHLAVLPGGTQILTAGGWHMDEAYEFQQPGDFAVHVWDLPPEVAAP